MQADRPTPVRRTWPGFVLGAALLAGCGSGDGTSGPDPGDARPVARAAVEILNLHSSNPNPDYDATCQTGAIVRLLATDSYDPKGQQLTYEWLDLVGGEPSADFGPQGNPRRTSELEITAGFFTVGAHELRLTVTAADGRKSSATVTLLVTSCEDCGG